MTLKEIGQIIAIVIMVLTVINTVKRGHERAIDKDSAHLG